MSFFVFKSIFANHRVGWDRVTTFQIGMALEYVLKVQGYAACLSRVKGLQPLKYPSIMHY